MADKILNENSISETENASNPNVNVAESTVATPPKKKVVKERTFEETAHDNVSFGLGINLIPTMSAEEVKVEESKTKINLSSLYVALFFIVLTITIFGVNIGYKLTLNTQRATNQELRAELIEKSYLVNTNNQTLDRLTFLKQLDSQSYSPKLVLNYFMDTFSKYGDVNSVELTNQLDFTIVGTVKSYKDSAMLWHKLTTDPNIKVITIRAVSKSSTGDVVFVTFEGQLNSQNFLKGIIE